MDEDEEIDGGTLTLKSDIFTLGIILCEYFTGMKPVLPSDCGSTWVCVEIGKAFSYVKSIPSGIKNLIDWMLKKNLNERPSINEVFEILKRIKTSDFISSSRPIIRDYVAPSSFPEKVGIRSTFKKEIKVETDSKTKKSSLRSKTWDVNK